jgi:4-hydroxybenzoate polyprenyltransferase
MTEVTKEYFEHKSITLLQFVIQAIITSRPLGWLMYWMIFVVGWVYGGGAIDTSVILPMLLIGPLGGFSMTVWNDMYDHESDILNPRKKHWIYGSVLQPKFWRPFIIATFVTSGIIMFYPLIWGNMLGLVFTALGLFISIGYSTPPLRFKERLFGDILSNVGGGFMLFFLGMSYNAGVNAILSGYPKLIVAFLVATAIALLSVAADYDADKASNQPTLATRIGLTYSYIITTILFIISTAISFFILDNSLRKTLVISILSVIVSMSLVAILRPRKDITHIVYIGSTFLVLLAGLIYIALRT